MSVSTACDSIVVYLGSSLYVFNYLDKSHTIYFLNQVACSAKQCIAGSGREHWKSDLELSFSSANISDGGLPWLPPLPKLSTVQMKQLQPFCSLGSSGSSILTFWLGSIDLELVTELKKQLLPELLSPGSLMPFNEHRRELWWDQTVTMRYEVASSPALAYHNVINYTRIIMLGKTVHLWEKPLNILVK